MVFCYMKNYTKKKNKNVSVYHISYKTSMDAKSLCIRFEKIDGFYFYKK